jgi:hypothetical protein
VPGSVYDVQDDGKDRSAMGRATLRLQSGLGASCAYELTDGNGGTLKLPSAIYLPLRESDVGTLRTEAGQVRRIKITFGPRVGQASFEFID